MKRHKHSRLHSSAVSKPHAYTKTYKILHTYLVKRLHAYAKLFLLNIVLRKPDSREHQNSAQSDKHTPRKLSVLKTQHRLRVIKYNSRNNAEYNAEHYDNSAEFWLRAVLCEPVAYIKIEFTCFYPAEIWYENSAENISQHHFTPQYHRLHAPTHFVSALNTSSSFIPLLPLKSTASPFATTSFKAAARSSLLSKCLQLSFAKPFFSAPSI